MSRKQKKNRKEYVPKNRMRVLDIKSNHIMSPLIEHDGNFPFTVYKLAPYRLTNVDDRVLAATITPMRKDFI